ncbi:MAG: DUF1134 domain-containing protein [Deltaproteobacteria bacterium]|nr:DUF1134 domain-containing protein [Deltaproteobacteria bacterium]MBW2413375.1 DUF1134 domain-containing protein [Deltaproteobacteria bacterium]
MKRNVVATAVRTALVTAGLAGFGATAALADEPAKTAPTPVPAPVEVETMQEQAIEPVTAAPPAQVEMESRTLAAGLGLRWGQGVLNFEGRNHGFEVRGLSLLDVGAAASDGIGSVTGLERLEDFEGRYVAVEAAAVAVRGAGVVTMRNEHGVVITLRSSQRGARLALGTQALSLSLQ